MEGKELLAHIVSLKDNIQRYLETRLSYYGVLTFEKAAKALSLLMANLFVAAILLLALFFISGAAVWFLGGLLDSYGYGMLIVGGFYLLLALIFYARRRNIFGRAAIRILQNLFIRDDSPDPKDKSKV
ncbi:MAG: phage holin family protein [Bacteroidales bacterium]